MIQPLGMVADVQRFSLHDGPGIRTTVFLKGCNMACVWCHNPETISPEPELLLHPERCIGCGACEEGCFAGAKVLCGKQRTVASLLEEVLQDRAYYAQDGGLTLSGGEPAFQAEFSAELLRAAKAQGLHTAVETNLSFSEDVMRSIWQHADLVLADLKLWDSALHQKYTGIGNEQVLRNLAACAGEGIPLIVQTPIIQGINDTTEEIGSIAAFVAGLPTLMYYELLPYHPLGLSKGSMENQLERFAAPDTETLHALALCAKAKGLPVRIAGKTFLH